MRRCVRQTEAMQRRPLRIIYSYTNDMPYINALYCASIPSLVDRREQLSRKFFTSILQPSSCLHTLLPTPRDPTITTRLICKQISTPPQPYQKIPDIYVLCSCSLPNFISIPSPITIQFVVDVFVLYVFLYFSLYCLIVLFGLTTTKLNKLYCYYYYYYDLLPGY